MISISKSNIRKTVNNILLDPTGAVPSLSFIEIKTLLIQTIVLYKKHQITLEAISKFAAEIQKSNKALPENLKNIITELSSFSVIDDVLTDMLHELNENTIKTKNS